MDYFTIHHFYVPYRLVWSTWFEFWNEENEPYYDVWY